MSTIRALSWLICLLSVFGQNAGQTCQDIDTNACKLISASRPDFCTDPSLANTACPRFCNLCPLECYHCNSTVQDYHECNTTLACSTGQVCMRKELTSFVDGHREYELTCENKEVCDGIGAMFHFGKRDTQTRDVSIHCCAKDLCNLPKDVTITNCGKDIEFMVDRSIGSIFVGASISLITFIFHVVSGLTIGATDNLVGLTEYDSHPHVQWELNAYSDKYDLMRAVTNMSAITTGPSNYMPADTDEAVEFIVNHALTPANGDRADHNDAVVIIATSSNANRISVNLRNSMQLQQLSHDIIVISVGQKSSTELDNIATDNNHLFHVSSYSGLDDTMVATVLNLLKSCA